MVWERAEDAPVTSSIRKRTRGTVLAKRLLERLQAPRSPLPEHMPDTLVLWAFHDYGGRWRVRQEGHGLDVFFDDRLEAIDFARAHGKAWGSYRLFFQLRNGSVAQEFFNLGRR